MPMTTARARSFPVNVSAYRCEFGGVEGFMLNVDGRQAFLDYDEAARFGAYLQTRHPNTEPVTLPPIFG